MIVQVLGGTVSFVSDISGDLACTVSSAACDYRHRVNNHGILLTVRNLKAFLKLRDNNAIFDEAKSMGAAGIPCFVLEDGRVTLTPEEAGLQSRPIENGASCSLDGKRC